MIEAIREKSLKLVQSAYHLEGWRVVGISEKRTSPDWEQGERTFLVALRKEEHAFLPFPGPLPPGMENIPNKAACVFWHNGASLVLDSGELAEFSDDFAKPMIDEVMAQFRKRCKTRLN